jgi:prefoldin subunit 5
MTQIELEAYNAVKRMAKELETLNKNIEKLIECLTNKTK